MDAARQAYLARDGPPRSYVIDGDVYALTRSWWPLAEHLQAVAGWRLPLLLDVTHEQDAAVLRERLHDSGDPLTVADLDLVADRLVEAVTGRPWWVAGRLLGWALHHWGELDGALLARGVDMARLVERAPGRACSVVYAFMVEGSDAKERGKFDHQLTQPPPEAREQEQARGWLAEDEGAMFMAAMGQASTSGAVRPGRAGGDRPDPGLSR